MAAFLYKGIVLNRKLFALTIPILFLGWWLAQKTDRASFMLVLPGILCFTVPIMSLDADMRSGSIGFYRSMPLLVKDYVASQYLLGLLASGFFGTTIYLLKRFVSRIDPTLAFYDSLVVLLLPLLMIAVTFPLFYRFTLWSLRRFAFLFSFANAIVFGFGHDLVFHLREWTASADTTPLWLLVLAGLIPFGFLFSYALSIRMLKRRTQ